ncbi:CsbD family protein [Streptomyces sp. NPDC056069]|uniref:CsbD family protein n=1 Tax=Streptomyces sp. NPDC056069 TaxID=3345702 RepID=UPI0035DF10E6
MAEGKRIRGKAQEGMGKVKEKAGAVTGREDLRAKGVGDQMAGKAKQAAGKGERKIKGAAEETKGRAEATKGRMKRHT